MVPQGTGVRSLPGRPSFLRLGLTGTGGQRATMARPGKIVRGIVQTDRGDLGVSGWPLLRPYTGPSTVSLRFDLLAVSVQKLTVDDNCSDGAEQRAVPERQITECDPTFIPK